MIIYNKIFKMQNLRVFKIIGASFSVIGIAITLYTVFDGIKSNNNIQNAGWVFILIGFSLTTYSLKKKK